MALKLTVTEPFDDYAKGSEITDPNEVKAILGSAHAVHVVKVNVPDPAPEPQA